MALAQRGVSCLCVLPPPPLSPVAVLRPLSSIRAYSDGRAQAAEAQAEAAAVSSRQASAEACLTDVMWLWCAMGDRHRDRPKQPSPSKPRRISREQIHSARAPALLLPMLPSAPLSPAVVDALLGVICVPDAPLSKLLVEFRSAFPSSTGAFHAACCCAQMIAEDAQLATLRPPQRIAALWILFNIGRDEPPPAVLAATPAAQIAWHAEQLRVNPFTETLLLYLDRGRAAFAAASSPPLRRIEYVFVLRLMALLQFAPNAPLRALSQWAQVSSSEHSTQQSSSAVAELAVRNSLDAFQAALEPLRQIVKESQPHPRIMQAIQPPTATLEAHIRAPAALVSFVLGDAFMAAARQTEAAASSVAVAASSSSSPSPAAAQPAGASASSESTLSLHVRAFPPHFSAPPRLPLDWGVPGWEDLLPPDSSAPPELSWMRWDPPDNLDWNAPLAVPAHLLSPSAVPQSPLTPSAAASGLATLLAKACKVQLPAAEKTQLLAELRAGSAHSTAASSAAPPPFEIPAALLTACHLVPPSRLPLLVEKNHEVASEFLMQFMATTQARWVAVASAPNPSAASALPSLPHTVNEYLSPLVQMEMSLHSMEVAKSLSMSTDSPLGSSALQVLPPDFLHLYICKCLSSCSKMQDKFLQARHVRLICAFLTTLIRKKIIHMGATPTAATTNNGGTEAAATNSASSSSSSSSSSFSAVSSSSAGVSSEYDVRDVLLVEVSSFLVEFSSHKDAANLYKLIKTMEANST